MANTLSSAADVLASYPTTVVRKVAPTELTIDSMATLKNSINPKIQNKVGNGRLSGASADLDVASLVGCAFGKATSQRRILRRPTKMKGKQAIACQPSGDLAMRPTKIGPITIKMPAIILLSVKALAACSRADKVIEEPAMIATAPTPQPYRNMEGIVTKVELPSVTPNKAIPINTAPPHAIRSFPICLAILSPVKLINTMPAAIKVK